jgi:hypothetical protein
VTPLFPAGKSASSFILLFYFTLPHTLAAVCAKRVQCSRIRPHKLQHFLKEFLQKNSSERNDDDQDFSQELFRHIVGDIRYRDMVKKTLFVYYVRDNLCF